MPKRFPVGPLGLHDDQWLNTWAWLNARSKAAQGTLILSHRIREKKTSIEEMLNFTAKRLGMTPEELFQAIQDGAADKMLAEYEERNGGESPLVSEDSSPEDS